MNRRDVTISTTYFDDLYTAQVDPWDFRSSAYEHAKYADTLAALERPRYATALEIGCSIGVFTRRLAARCDRLVSVEPSMPALTRARAACADLANVTFGTDSLPGSIPAGPFELIVLSEVLYYLDRADAVTAAGLCCDALAPGGEIVLCHWLGETDYPLTGDQAAEIALTEAHRRRWRTRSLRRERYRLDHVLATAA